MALPIGLMPSSMGSLPAGMAYATQNSGGFNFDDIIGGASLLLGGMGKADASKVTNLGGYESLPPALKTYMTDVLLPRVKAYADKKYEGLPKRRLNAEDLDPVFGSRARQDLQAWSDAKYAAKPGETASDAAGALAQIQNMIAANDFLNRGSMNLNGQTVRPVANILSRMSRGEDKPAYQDPATLGKAGALLGQGAVGDGTVDGLTRILEVMALLRGDK